MQLSFNDDSVTPTFTNTPSTVRSTPNAASTPLSEKNEGEPSVSDNRLLTSFSVSVEQRIGIPQYSAAVKLALEKGQLILELDKFIEETAYHILKCGDLKDKSDYSSYGQYMYKKFPMIHFESRTGDSFPWVIKF